MSKPLFTTDGWNMPSNIAKEVSAKNSIGKSGIKREEALNKEVIKIANELFGNSSKDSAIKGDNNKASEPSESILSVSTEGNKKNKKKNKKRKAQALCEPEPALLNLGTSESKIEIVKESAEKNVAQTKQQTKKAKISVSQGGMTPLQEKMNKKLQGAKFRMINEMLYTMPGDQAFKKFQEEPDMFEEYHTGFRSQVESWPANPVDVFIKYFQDNIKANMVIADMGCGEAELALKLPESIKVHSFDLVAANSRITACDISHTPLGDASVDAVVFSLSLMGTNYHEFIVEAHRILKSGGELKIAEVISRFDDLDSFIAYMSAQGFSLTHRDETNKMFVMLDFIKGVLKGKAFKKARKNAKFIDSKQSAGVEAPILKPCIYKRR